MSIEHPNTQNCNIFSYLVIHFFPILKYSKDFRLKFTLFQRIMRNVQNVRNKRSLVFID